MTMLSRAARVCFNSCLFCAVLSLAAARPQNPTSAPQNDSAPSEGFKIAGTVVNAITGAPLARAKVSLANTRARAPKIAVLTDAGGHFEFNAVPPGKYELQGSRRGYIASAYEQHEQYSTAIVTGPEFLTDKLVLRLMPMALITGHVLDESGELVRDAQVNLFLEDHGGGMSRVRHVDRSSTDDRGYFDFNALRPVHPAVDQAGGGTDNRLSSAVDVAYPTTYYGGGTESDGAAPIELKGAQTQDIEIRLAPVPALHLFVRVPAETPGETNVFRHPVFEKRVFDSVEFVNTGQTQPVSPGLFSPRRICRP